MNVLNIMLTFGDADVAWKQGDAYTSREYLTRREHTGYQNNYVYPNILTLGSPLFNPTSSLRV
jgi:hypothetical protein